MKRTDNPMNAMDIALNYLAYRMRSETEMQRYLSRKQISEDEIKDTIERLRELSLIDDTAYANEMVRSQTATKAIGRRALDYKMNRAGVSEQDREAGLSQYTSEQEQEACQGLVDAMIARYGMDVKGLAKVQRAALYRGFTYEMIRNAVQRHKEV